MNASQAGHHALCVGFYAITRKRSGKCIVSNKRKKNFNQEKQRRERERKKQAEKETV